MIPTLSIIIKTLNEEKNIEKCLNSVVSASKNIKTEVILADSLSSDNTLEKAKKYPIKIVQLKDPDQRCCGIGPQLGYQYAEGEYVYILDGDMEIDQQFLETAIHKLETTPLLAGVGGSVKEMCLENLVFKKRAKKEFRYGNVNHLGMGGLYKRKAIEEAGYLSNMNLHSFEELELGLRLVSKGWTLERINMPAIKHYGHTDTSLRLLLKRLKTKYVHGYGELIRSALGQPYFLSAVWNAKILLTTLILWIIVAILLLNKYIYLSISILMISVIIMSLKKGSVNEALFSIFTWHVETLGLILGFFTKQKKPNSKIESNKVKW